MGRGLKKVHVEATTLPDAWFQCVYKCLEVGRDFIIDRGSYAGEKRLEFDWIEIHIRQPWHEPLLPSIPEQYNMPDPVDPAYLYGGEGYEKSYIEYLMDGYCEPDEAYTYGERLNNHRTGLSTITTYNKLGNESILIQERDIWEKIFLKRYHLSQVELLIWTYKNKGFRNNQMCLQIAQPDDILLIDPPCLRHIDTRIQDDTLHFFPYFRSWDLWGGFPANMAAIETLKQYIAGELGVKNGEIIATSKGLHLYKYVWELAECIRGKTIEEFREEFRQ